MKPKVPNQPLEPLRAALVYIFLVFAIWYLTWRLGTFNHNAYIFSLLLYLAEIFGFMTTLMHLFMTWRLTVREPPSPHDGLTVDVFILTINEPVSLLRKTLLAALEMSYPHITWLLDDGNRQEMKALAEELGCQYLTRPDNKDAKAGNLNYALKHSNGEFIAVFDADHAPSKNFLLRTLGYLQDEQVAFVQTPQDFYNFDSFQHHIKSTHSITWHEQSVFFRVIQRGKDYWNAAFFCGSCALFRRSALDAIGGFATETVTEDLHTSIKIHKKGFRSVYHAEPLAFGLAPSNLVPYLKQRIRWGQGATQVWKKEGIIFCRGLTMAQRINYFASAITYFDGWQKAIFYITPAFVLFSGVMPFNALGPDFLRHFIPYYFLSFWVFEEVNRGYGRAIVIEQYNMARFAALAWSTLGFFKKKIRFSVTPKDRQPQARFFQFIAPQALILTINFIAIPFGIFLYQLHHRLPIGAIIANSIWASVNVLLAASVLIFSAVRARFKRADYRFPIHLPAKMDLSNNIHIYGIIDDISHAGFRFYASLPSDIPVGLALTGKVYLPGGMVKVNATTKSLIPGKKGKESYVKAIGCSFNWYDRHEQDKVDMFLYGSDLQCRLNDFQDRIHTPLEKVSSFFSRSKKEYDVNSKHWAAITYASIEARQQDPGVGLISINRDQKTTRKLLTFTPLREDPPINLSVYTRSGISWVAGMVLLSKRIDNAASPLYVYDFIPAPEYIP
jgi:cellulose synthase (UDP-forming)